MSETSTSDENNDDLEQKYSDEPTYTLTLNEAEYAMTKSWRREIQDRAEREYSENHMFSCWWRTADGDDAADEDSVHEQGDPILVIETEGPIVPWERLDQLELEEQTNDAFDGMDSGGGMKTVDPDDVKPGSASENETREKNRTHFSITPQDYEEVPSPEGEDPDKIPPKPDDFDEPKMVMWVPDNPDITHSWSTGEAMVPMYNWVEWNVQQRANQPRVTRDKNNWHDHFESLAELHDCEQVGEVEESEDTDDSKGESGSVQRKGKDWFDGDVVGDRWNV